MHRYNLGMTQKDNSLDQLPDSLPINLISVLASSHPGNIERLHALETMIIIVAGQPRRLSSPSLQREHPARWAEQCLTSRHLMMRSRLSVSRRRQLACVRFVSA